MSDFNGSRKAVSSITLSSALDVMNESIIEDSVAVTR